MSDLVRLLQRGDSWLFVPTAILLGALHGLEPGHSKTMMAAFIVAIRGTLAQAVLLGLSATLSHTAVVWAVAMAGLYFGRSWNAATTEPYFQIASAALIVAVAIWMIARTRRDARHALRAHSHDHDHDHGHEEAKLIDTGHGRVRLEIFEAGTPPRFRLHPQSTRASWPADQIRIETERRDGRLDRFTFVQRAGYWESVETIPEPHEFVARLRLGTGHHHDFDVEFVEHDHEHHVITDYAGLDVAAPGYQDPHELAHANDIRRRFASRHVTTWQIAVFGLTGGLIPCPASVTVLLLCLQLKRIALGATLVLCFSIGLAVTMVSTGAAAALSMKHVARRWSGFETFARRAPYFSGAVILLVGAVVGYQGLHTLRLIAP